MIAIATLLAIDQNKDNKGMEDKILSTRQGSTVVEKDDSNSNVVSDSNIASDNDSKDNSKDGGRYVWRFCYN